VKRQRKALHIRRITFHFPRLALRKPDRHFWHVLRDFSFKLPAGNFIILQTIIMATQFLTAQDFKDKIFNYEEEENWEYKGQLPAIIDFYADWCGPCRAVAPALEELSNEYEGRLVIYKIDTDKEAELSGMFGIQSIPTFLFIPVQGAPMMQRGALPKKAFQQVIEDRLLQKAAQQE
jgi:thioredoxin